MIPIKIQCACGQRYAFDVEPVAGRMPSSIACPACGADGTAAANEIISQNTASQTGGAARPVHSSPAAPAGSQGGSAAFVQLDFIRKFPHVIWVSSLGHDGESPDGFRYKMFATRREPDMIIELLLLHEKTDGAKRVVFHKQAPMNKFAVVDGLIRQIEQDKNIRFDRFDLSHIRTLDDFRDKAIEVGWEAARGA